MLRPRTVLPCAAIITALLAAAPAQAGTYTVRSGDNLTGIAARYHTTLEKLAHANGLKPYGILLIGTRLKVPSHSAPPPRATTTARIVAISATSTITATRAISMRLRPSGRCAARSTTGRTTTV
jgi:LysM repeat protein